MRSQSPETRLLTTSACRVQEYSNVHRHGHRRPSPTILSSSARLNLIQCQISTLYPFLYVIISSSESYRLSRETEASYLFLSINLHSLRHINLFTIILNQLDHPFGIHLSSTLVSSSLFITHHLNSI
ncbi:hypothetical protein O181_001824 [Austropuccinia psidii MF-1]|uniref:Uncharacterized protein n=1 Tax=Austropuccinia psidii MF-1 TaxID=1389203 RepID=A0A9Q3BBB0_9BASI|nr:hypothetical protein [Austropuccinia psidii MF-1]